MKEKLDYTRISTKVDVSIGPDGKVLRHSVISPDWRQVKPKKLTDAIDRFERKVNEPCLSELFKKNGKVIFWINSGQNEILAATTEGF